MSWPSPEQFRENFDSLMKAGEYGSALTFANFPGIDDDCIRETIAYLLAIANNVEQDKKIRLNAFLVARSFFWKRESFKDDPALHDSIFKSEFAVQAPLWVYI